MGYLDRKSRVVDFVLTGRGRRLYASGRLDFAYFSLSDDGVDYDPWSPSGLSDDEREIQVAAPPTMEAPVVPDRSDDGDPLGPLSHLFTAAAGYSRVPRAVSSTSSLDLRCDQRRAGSAYARTATNLAQIDLTLSGQAERSPAGFEVRVYSSGSSGLTRLHPRRDLAGRRSLDPFIAVSVDSELPPDRPSVDDPASNRVPVQPTSPALRRRT